MRQRLELIWDALNAARGVHLYPRDPKERASARELQHGLIESPLGGCGAFTRKGVAGGTRLGRYEGAILTKEAAASMYPTGMGQYVMEIGGLTVDAASAGNLTRWINHAEGNAATCEIRPGGVFAVRPTALPRNTELTADYGALYAFGPARQRR